MTSLRFKSKREVLEVILVVCFNNALINDDMLSSINLRY